MRALLFFLFTALPATAASVTLAWDPNPEPDIAGYKIYVGEESGVYEEPIVMAGAPEEPQFKVVGLENGRDYYFVVTAFNEAGLESDYSNEVVAEIPENFIFDAPTFEQKRLTLEGDLAFTVQWEQVPGAASYEVWAGGARIRTAYDPETYVDLQITPGAFESKYAVYYIKAVDSGGQIIAISAESERLLIQYPEPITNARIEE